MKTIKNKIRFVSFGCRFEVWNYYSRSGKIIYPPSNKRIVFKKAFRKIMAYNRTIETCYYDTNNINEISFLVGHPMFNVSIFAI